MVAILRAYPVHTIVTLAVESARIVPHACRLHPEHLSITLVHAILATMTISHRLIVSHVLTVASYAPVG